MEDIYTIKVRTHPNPANLYPSERRYSASTVLGLGVVHLALGITAFLLATLTLIAKNDEMHLEQHLSKDIESIPIHLTIKELQDPEIARKIEMFSRTNIYIKRHFNNSENITAKIFEDQLSNSTHSVVPTISPFFTLAPCVMSLTAFVAGCTAILAWRRWYIDNNITWFFIASTIATTISLISFIAIVFGITSTTNFKLDDYYASNPNQFVLHSENGIEILRPIDNTTTESSHNFYERKSHNLRVVLALNIAISALLEFIWSYLSMRIAWRGMRNNYSDDIINDRGAGNTLRVNTVMKGKKINPRPDIIAHYPKKGKIAKYFPKIDNYKSSGGDYLPKAESHKEFQERVNKFLTSNSCEESLK